ncbi:MAG: carboxypeptidase-like regulatory domain-containing protein [Thiobacillaceae bacterium]|jgi:hypothetical protein|nr:carboxypeptidase-like regulatory domain-containing protein [Thiobacillaceae bacterium]
MQSKRAFGMAMLAVGALLVASPAWTDPGEPVPYMSGGVGKGERERLRQAAEDYNLKLVFHTREQGAFLARVQVTIRDPDGKALIRTTSDGPWFYVRLPPGPYHVTGEVRGITVGRMIDVPAEGQIQVNYCWPD